MIEVLHITAHLGGGVGKALSGLVRQSAASGSDTRHTIVTLEEQEKPQFAELIAGCGCQLAVCPTPEQLCRLIEASDIVQLEWWNHPATLQALCGQPLPPMRLLVWSHVSGLYTPVLPLGLLRAAHQFLFTSACSFAAREVATLPAEVRETIGVVSSCGGFDGLPGPELRDQDALCAGYVGTLGFAKLHPRYLEFLTAVTVPHFTVRLIGDLSNQEELARQCRLAGREGLLEFRGYRRDIAAELGAINVLAYLLNPEHYGTTENALLEAMATGVVPIVLDNPAERQIVEDGRTGCVVTSPLEFAEAVGRLARDPARRQAIGRQAAEEVRSRFAVSAMVASLDGHYRKVMPADKREIPFVGIFGSTPWEWFLSCQGNRGYFSSPGSTGPDPASFSFPGLFEETKGTVFHFRKKFPNDSRLRQWALNLNSHKSC